MSNGFILEIDEYSRKSILNNVLADILNQLCFGKFELDWCLTKNDLEVLKNFKGFQHEEVGPPESKYLTFIPTGEKK